MNRVVVKGLILFAICIMASNQLYAQDELVSPRKNEVVIGNTQIYREGDELVVDYRILMGDNVKSCKIDVLLYADDKLVKEMTGLKGDFGKIKSPGLKQIRYSLDNQKAKLAGKEIKFTFNVRNKDVLEGKYLIMPSLLTSTPMSYGIMVGYVRKFGGYIRAKSNFKFIKSSYSSNQYGELGDGSYMWTSGNSDRGSWQVLAGGLYRASRHFYPYVGIGYGVRNIYWEDTEGLWAKISDISCSNVAAEAGFILKCGPIALSPGVSTIGFKHIYFDFGVGVMF